MCRRNHLQGCAVAAFGLGLLVGHSIESWLVCLCTGTAAIGLGLLITRQR